MANSPTHMWTPLLLALLAVLVASAAGQAAGAARGSAGLTIFAAAAFVGGVLWAAWRLNRPWWHSAAPADIGPLPANAQPMLAARNATLIALGYAWGAASLFAVYLGTPLRWQHGWQYGSGMALIGLAIYLASRRFEGGWSEALKRNLTWATLIHGWAATAGVAWLIGTAKLFSEKGDWAANIVFACGAVIIAGVGAMSLRTVRLLGARHA